MKDLAVVLHGKIGDMQRPGISPTSVRAVDGAHASPQLVAMCFAALVRHVIEPNLERFHVGIVGHSWSPAIGEVIGALFRPFLVSSRHESPPPLQSFRCSNPALDPLLCHRAFCQLLGIKRALELKRGVESERGKLCLLYTSPSPRDS